MPPDTTLNAPRPQGGQGAVALALLRRDTLRDVLVAAFALAAAAAAVAAPAGFGADYVLRALLLYAAAGVLLWRGLPAHLPHTRFGPGNRLTLLRLALVALFAALLGEPLRGHDPIAWSIVVAATVGAVLDAADGPLARASGLASDFGARFDMETDALLMLVLCLLILQFDKTGPWVVAAGLMRYAFVAAMAVWPWLARPLPPSWRRKAVCVAQITSLIVCLGPIIDRFEASLVAGLSLAALGYSFAVDVLWLARRRHQPMETAA